MSARNSRQFLLLVFTLLPTTFLVAQEKESKPLAKTKSPTTSEKISWITMYNTARLKGTKADKPVFLFITTDSCRHCIRMQKESFENKNIAKVIKSEFVPAKLHLKMDSKLAEDLRITIYPTTLMIAPDGKILDYARGYLSQAELTSRMKGVSKQMAIARQEGSIATASR
jgi:uncharacterized protein YyaL (SSP411 family)